MIRTAAALWMLCSSAAFALDFTLPLNARQTVTRDTGPDIYDAPVGVFAQGAVPMITLEGEVKRSAWRITSPGLTPFQVMQPLREQLIASGFEVALDCRDVTCGGFDFRFATETLPGPNMYVNIRSYQFVTGLRALEGEVTEAVTLLASTSATSAYVQIIHAGTFSQAAVSVETTDIPVSTAPTGNPLGDQLLEKGHVVLRDLDFDSGRRDLGEGPFNSLDQLAQFLKSQSEMRVALVGHTDNVGGLQANIAVSRARAASVRQRLIEAYDVAADRLDAEGMGYLSPIATNRAAAGRDANRRVEVVLLESAER